MPSQYKSFLCHWCFVHCWSSFKAIIPVKEDHLHYVTVVCFGVEKIFRPAKNGELSSDPQVDTEVHDMFCSPQTSCISLYNCIELNTKLVLNKAATAFGKKEVQVQLCQKYLSKVV